MMVKPMRLTVFARGSNAGVKKAKRSQMAAKKKTKKPYLLIINVGTKRDIGHYLITGAEKAG